MLVRLVNLLYFKSIQSVANVLSATTFTLDSPDELLAVVHRLLQQQDARDELFDQNLKTVASINEKTFINMPVKNKEAWNRGRFNLQRYFFHRLKEVFHLLFDVLHLSLFDNTVYSLAFFSHGDLFLNLLLFFPAPISKLLAEVTRNVGRIVFRDSRFSPEPRRPGFDLKQLLEKEGHLRRAKLLNFRSDFFGLSDRFVDNAYKGTVFSDPGDTGRKKSCLEFPHITE